MFTGDTGDIRLLTFTRFLLILLLSAPALAQRSIDFMPLEWPDHGALVLPVAAGEELTGLAAELDQRAEALVDLYRAITMRDWNTPDLRGGAGYLGGGRGEDQGGDYRGHDNLAAWYFGADDVVGERLDRAEFEEAKTRFYRRMGWDEQTGAVTRAKLEAILEQHRLQGIVEANTDKFILVGSVQEVTDLTGRCIGKLQQ